MGALFVSNKNETVRMFKNPILEYFSHIHPITPVVAYMPLVCWMLWRGVMATSVLEVIPAFAIGVLLWTGFEYTMHRWAFHLTPTTKLGKQLHFLVHGVHHDYPRDATRLVMPLLVSAPLAVIFFYGYRFFFAPFNDAVFAGTVFGYVAYDSIHYASHHWNMKGRIGRFIKEYHMKHHYVDEHTAYGVSTPLWDYVCGTVPEWAKQRRSKSTISSK